MQGKYVVRLWCSGAWRAVSINDELPINAKGECVFPATSEPRELWPMLIAKVAHSASSLY